MSLGESPFFFSCQCLYKSYFRWDMIWDDVYHLHTSPYNFILYVSHYPVISRDIFSNLTPNSGADLLRMFFLVCTGNEWLPKGGLWQLNRSELTKEVTSSSLLLMHLVIALHSFRRSQESECTISLHYLKLVITSINFALSSFCALTCWLTSSLSISSFSKGREEKGCYNLISLLRLKYQFM